MSMRLAPSGLAEGAGRLPPENELWDLKHAALFLKMSESWVYKRVADGTLPVRRLNGFSLRFEPSELRAWAASNVGGGRRRRFAG